MALNRPGEAAAASPNECVRGYLIALLDAAAALLAEAHLLGQLRAGGRVVGRHHRIVGAEPPFLAVLLGRHVVLGAQMALERLELFAVFQTDDVFGRDRLFLTETAGFSGSAGASLALPLTRASAVWT